MRNRNLAYLLSGQLVSQVGDKFHMIALSFWVLKTTGSSAKMGAVLAASVLPSLVLGFFSGVFIDRYNRKRIIVGTDVLRGLIIASFAVLFYLEIMNFYVVLLMQALLSVNAAFFDPTIPAVIPQIVDEKDLGAANAKHQFVNGFSTVAGAFLGGIFISSFGYLWVFAINAFSFLLSAGFECFIQIPTTQQQTPPPKRADIFEDLKKGYQYLYTKRVLIILLLMVMVVHFFVGSIEVFMPVIAKAISTDGAKMLGFFHAAFGLGNIAMAVLLSGTALSGKEKPALFGSVFLVGMLFVLASFLKGSDLALGPLFIGIIFLFGGCIICAAISFKTLLQKNIDSQFSGRLFAVAGSVGNGSIPFAMILYGFLLDLFQFEALLMISGWVLMPLSMISYRLYKEETNGRENARISKLQT
jgi:DHA3 family macrolide efflux protein-like MFS transporter